MKTAAALLGLLLVGILVVYSHPKTRPYLQKYWWGGLVLLGFIVGLVLAMPRGRKGQQALTPILGTWALEGILAATASAEEQRTEADLELTRLRMEAQAMDRKAREDLVEFEAQVAIARGKSDAAARRAALTEIVNRARGAKAKGR